ncbi:hypothetical protein KSF78_0007048 [Schistosoma japonicum]|nr:hypothetical protein KSF78_0007048 [Schistosoma japonicum]
MTDKLVVLQKFPPDIFELVIILFLHTLDNLLYPKGPGSGAAQILNNSKSTLRVGTLSAIDSWESNAYSLFMPLVSDGRAEFRENSPMAISLDSIEYQRKIENQLLGGLDDETDSCHTLKRPFKPLFYTDSSLYCTSMPFQDGVEYGSPDDGLIIRPTKLGLFILHVTGNFPPTYSLNLLERCFQPFGL